ncbi:MAG: hypothetical protein Q8R24_03275 [Legionellaceae bacterium]|nr:hypothetical protein [Legionellaceae bacterium]
MLYIEIPDGMEYRQVDSTNKKGEPVKEDLFVAVGASDTEALRKSISIQESVHKFYHIFHQRSVHTGTVNGLTFYKRKPLHYDKLLEYRAENSGLLPSNHVVIIEPRRASPTSPMEYIGRTWMDFTLLSEERRKKATKTSCEQKLNRRKEGPSPNAN